MASDLTNFEAGDECASCYEEFDNSNTVEYQNRPDGNWIKSPYCSECIQYLLDTGWAKYMTDVKKADCKASLRRALQEGPPVNLRDNVFKRENENDTGEIYQLKYSGTIQSAKLKDSLEGESRNEWWTEWKQILENMEIEDSK